MYFLDWPENLLWSISVWPIEHVVLARALRVIGVSSRIRIVLNIADISQPELRELRIDVRRNPKTWAGPLLEALRNTIPPEQISPPTLVSPLPDLTAATEAPAMNPWPWFAIGGGVVAGGIGAIFGVRSADARTAGEAQFLPDAEFERLEGRAVNSGITANIMFGAAAVGIVTGVVLLLTD